MESSRMDSSQLRQCLEEVQAEILQHQMHLDALEKRRRELETELGNIVYPVLTLPPELVSQIFVQCLPNHGRVRPRAHAPPHSLSQVCHLWREIALSSWDLWSSVDLLFIRPPGSPREFPNTGALPLLETWFLRAKDSPLSVTIRSGDAKLDPRILSLISSVAGRIRSLELHVEVEEDALPLCRTHTTFPYLRRFAARCRGFEDDGVFDNLNTPFLQDLSLNRYPSLTSIELGHIYERDLVNLSHQFPQLLHLTAKLTVPSESQSENIILPHLQSLNLSFGDLNTFTLPSLRRLDINSTFPFLGSSLTVLAFVKRSACVLEHIGLHFGDLVDCLEAIPSVVSLSVVVDGEISQFGEFISSEPTPLPRLRTLVVSAMRKQFNYFSFIHLIRARRGRSPTGARLESVQLDLHGTFDGEWLSGATRTELGKLISEGLKLQVTYNGYGWPQAIDDCERFLV
ncbi:hypothetical protein B0H16DRAFT_1515718 [Mycena metata]|uniref:F-box domain-containing protein n=1 Tax=Mycena metata TaxID=1033252 RepID=A0AAD7JRS1_9AGAR|nr:hypothetical protein B0H16DRAFT_1515718 [Mycena metata]